MKFSKPAAGWLALAGTLVCGVLVGSARGDVKTVHQHAVLGFSVAGAMPPDIAKSDGLLCIPGVGCNVNYQLGVSGIETSVSVGFGADFDLSWDRANVRSIGMPPPALPLELAYTPTNDSGPEFTIEFDGFVAALLEVIVPPIICAVPAQPIHFSGMAGDLHAPLSNDGTMTIPVESTEVLAICLGAVNLPFSLKVEGDITLKPVASFDSTDLVPPVPALPLIKGTTLFGVGGGTGTLSVDSAAGSMVVPLHDPPEGDCAPGDIICETARNLFPIEWQTSGEAQTRKVRLRNPPASVLHARLDNVLHFMEVEADLDLSVSVAIPDPIGDLHLFSTGILDTDDLIDAINKKSCQDGPNKDLECESDADCPDSVCADLGKTVGDTVRAKIDGALASNNVPEDIRNVLSQAYGDAFQNRVENLQIPIPLLDPEGSDIGGGFTSVTFGHVDFDVPIDSDGDGLADGDEISMGSDPDDPDSDDDGLDDGDEATAGTDPHDPDTDDDGYSDGDEVHIAHCDPLDGSEIPLQPTIFGGSRGGGQLPPNELMTYASPGRHTVRTASDNGCMLNGMCSAGFCNLGRIGDPCVSNGDCNQPPLTCRVIINFRPDATDLMLVKAEYNRLPLSNVASPPGCSRKLDFTIDPNTNRNKLKLIATGTVAGRKVRDKDSFNFHR